MRKKIAIIGGGLSGLYAAYQLEQKGITDYVLLEARAHLGGRISDFLSNSQSKSNSFDLGPTWFWPEFQPQLSELIKSLKLETFAQFEQGHTLIERSSSQPPTATPGYMHSPTSMRIKGGMGKLINALYAKLQNKHVVTSASAESITYQQDSIEIRYSNSDKPNNTVYVEHAMLALPPRLAVEKIAFNPTLPSDVIAKWQNTATWMAPHAKYIAVYDTPFWRKQGLSGSARSSAGPMVEIHDASYPQGQAALFGFIGVPATDRQRINNEDLKAYCRAQLARLFGTQAATPEVDVIKDWAQDELTSTHLDKHAANAHAPAPYITPPNGPWHQRLVGIGSEWSTQFPGYLAGAVDAASKGVEHYIHTY